MVILSCTAHTDGTEEWAVVRNKVEGEGGEGGRVEK
jgi:hypothetical protein